MRTVGTQTRSEFENDPIRAWHRGVALDAMLRAAMPHPRPGVWRLTHARMNQADLDRQRLQAAKLNRNGA